MITHLLVLFGVSSCVALHSYVVTFPNALIPGVPLNIRVSILKSTSAVNVETRLEHASNRSLVIATHKTFQKGLTDTIQLQVPDDLLSSDYTLNVTGSGGLTFNNESKIRFEDKSLYMFIQTDKTRYSAGQEVKFRVIFLLPNLNGYGGVATLSIFDGNNNRIQVIGPTTTKDGVITGRLQISKEPVFGDWKIVATAKDKSSTKGFEVNAYVLPKFNVNIQLETGIKETDSSFVVMITSRFTFNNDVFGKCTVQIYNADDTTKFIEYSQQIKGGVNFTVQMSDLRSKLSMYSKINIRALVTDNATALTMAAEKELVFTTDKNVYQKPIEVTKTDRRDTFVPGLHYYTTIFVGRGDDPLGYRGFLRVTPTIETAEERDCLLNHPPTKWLDVQTTTLSEFVIHFNESGIAPLFFSVPKTAETIDFRLTYGSITSYIHLTSISSEHVTMLRVSPDKTKAKVGEYVVYSIEATDVLNGDVVMEIYARGILIETQTKTLSLSNNTSMVLRIKPEMVPLVYVLITHTTLSGSLITDDVAIEVDGNPCKNNVTVSFNTTLLEPRQGIEMRITADPNSTVYLLSEDEKNRLLGSNNDVFLYEIEETVDSIVHDIDENAAFYPANYGRKRTIKRPPRHPKRTLGNYGDVDDIFIEAGVIVLTDTYMFDKNSITTMLSSSSSLPTECILITTTISYTNGFTWAPNKIPKPYPGQTYAPGKYPTYVPGMVPTPAPGMTYAPSMVPTPAPALALSDIVRSRFPETWIWDEYTIGPSGQISVGLPVPDSITSWVTSVFATNHNSGFGIADTKYKITVKKQFFITMDLPSSIVLGEEFLLQVTVFSYLSTSQQVFVQVSHSDDPSSPIPSATVVKPGEGHSTYIHITPKNIGALKISVVAKAGFFSVAAKDSIEKDVTVRPAGVHKQSNEQHLVSVSSSMQPFLKSISLTDPANMVSGTKKLKMSLTGNFMVPSISGLQNLIRMPSGCGEQTMLNFAPDIYITKYLKVVGKLTKDIESKSKSFMESGLQNELKYQHTDGSFSAFGNRDTSGSTWLTAFVLKCFQQADGILAIDDATKLKAMNWLLNYRRSDGSFYEPGRIIHTQMQAETGGHGIKLSAFILNSLLENRNMKGLQPSTINAVITKGTHFLESKLSSVQDMYTLALVCYALAKAGSSQKTTCFTKIKHAATLDDDKMFWRANDNVYRKRSNSPRALATRARSADIEATSYILLTYINMGKISEAFPIVKWLVGQRNPQGGFASTQDTVISLQALAEYSSNTGSKVSSGSSYGVDFNAYGGTFHHAYSTTVTTIDIVHVVEIPNSLTNIIIQAMGEGSAVVDITMSYYVNGLPGNSVISVNATITKESLNSVTVHPCISWQGHSTSGMIVMEVEMPTGFVPDNEIFKSQAIIKKHETNGRNIALYFDGIGANSQVCVDVKMDRSDPVVKSQACHITVYDYYDPTNQAMTRYESGILKRSNICDVCPLCNFCSGASGFGQIGVGK